MKPVVPIVHLVRPSRAFVHRFFAAALFIAGATAQLSAAASALLFDGANDYVTFGPAPALGAATFTVETWFKRNGAGVSVSTGTGGVTAIPLVAKGRSEADGTRQDMNYFLGIRSSDNRLVADFEEGATGASPGLNHPVIGSTPISSGVWHHAAVTYDGSKWQLFLNGALEAELAVGRPPRADSIQHAALGSTLNSTGAAAGFFSGVIDEVRIWNYARTSAQIAGNKDLEITAAPGLIGRWGLNEGSGTQATDSSGTGATGTLVNGPLWTGGFGSTAAPVVTRGPYLQIGTPSSIIIRWRTDVACDSMVRYGTAPDALGQLTTDPGLTTEHEVKLTSLAPDTRYFYAIATSTATLAGGPDYLFFTSPAAGTAQPTRVWVLGDSGTANSVAAGVRNGYTNFNGARYTDVWLMLGDNAYNSGTDPEYQAAVFNMYPSYLRQSVLWSAIGNHDTAGSTNPSLSIPHFQIFNNPMNGEAGGAPSGTEKYYSFDYGRIHFICLDSMTSSRAIGSAMLTWLQNDLENTLQDWIIAFWHHPPYTKGSHNSDTEIELVEMRQNVLPLLEAGGVDLVLAGHSHSYERSYFLNGHYGVSSTFNNTMKIDGGSGREDGSGAYDKPAGLVANQGAVYAVAGNGGHVTNWTGGSTAEFNPTPHPAMFYSALHVGSLVLDIDGNRLDAKMIRETGAVDDYFTIVKNVSNAQPTVAITGPAEGATFTAPASIAVTAAANDSDGTVAQVDFYAGSTLIGTATTAPFSVSWNDVAEGNYVLSAAATDNLGATTISGAVNIFVTSSVPPAAPTGLAATAGNAQVALTWTGSAGASSYSVKRAGVTGGPYAAIAGPIGGTTFTDTSVTNGTTFFYVVTASNGAGESATSAEVSATPTAPPTPPAAPTNLIPTVVSRTQINLTWADNASNETGYLIERSLKRTSAFAQIGIAGANATSFSDTGVVRDKRYFYRVRATNGAGQSAYSNTAEAKTPK